MSLFCNFVRWLGNCITSKQACLHNPKSLRHSVWDWPIWHLPILQLVNHGRLTVNILRATRTRNERIDDLKSLCDLKFITDDMVHFLKKRVGDKALKNATKDLSVAEADLLSTKLMEAVFESGPQFILQLSIILKVGNVEAHQAATMLISLASFWYSTTKFCLQMPTKKTPLRSATIFEFAFIFIPTMMVILSRFTVWSFLTAYLGFQILIPVGAAFLYMIAVHRKKIDLTSKRDMIELLANVLVPCISKDEYTDFYQSGSATTSVVLMVSSMYIMVSAHEVNSNPPILTCFEPSDWTPSLDDVRCHYNQAENRITELCMNRLLNFGLGFGFGSYRTICHQAQQDGIKQSLLLAVSGSFIGILFLSQFLTTYCIQPFLDPLVRLRVASSWNYFYQTNESDVRFVLQAKNLLNCLDWKIIFLSAIDDNIDSLIKHLLDTHNCNTCHKVDLFKSGLARCHDNPQIRDEIKRSLAVVGQCATTESANENQTMDHQQKDIESKVTLDMKHCNAKIGRLNRKLASKTQAPEEVLAELTKADDNSTFSHFLHCHKHLCTKVVEFYNDSRSSEGPAAASPDISQLSKLVKIPQRIEDEALRQPGSQVQIHMKYHNFWCQEMIRTLTNSREEFIEMNFEATEQEEQPFSNHDFCPKVGHIVQVLKLC